MLLTAHYDSKIVKGDQNEMKEFFAATDSAVPCAMILAIAKDLDLNALKKVCKYLMKLIKIRAK